MHPPVADLGAAFAAIDVDGFLFGAQAAVIYGVAPCLEDEFFARVTTYPLDASKCPSLTSPT